MTDTEIIIAVAKLCGWEYLSNSEEWKSPLGGLYYPSQLPSKLPPYLTSRDAIIPVIYKIVTTDNQWGDFFKSLGCDGHSQTYVGQFKIVLSSTPRQLAIALLKAIQPKGPTN